MWCYETDYLLRGVAVPEGTHEIVFTYQPRSPKYGLYITLATSVIALIIALWVCFASLGRNRRANRGLRQ